jgi:hypothetical protein
MLFRICFLLALNLILAAQANADLVLNGSFEEPGFGWGYYRYLIDGDNSIAHWTVHDDGIGEMPYWYNFGSPGSPYTNGFDGLYALSLNIGSSIETNTSLVSGTTYRLSFWATQAANDPLAVFAPLEVTVGGLTQTFEKPSGLQSFTFTAISTDTNALLRFANNSTGSDHKIYALDAVSLTAVPEPAATVTIFGVLGLLAMQRRRIDRAPSST